jgi:phospholipase/carboxylesterase
MKPEFIGPLRVHALGGVDRKGGGSGPAILLCHGYGALGDDLVPLARVVDAGRSVRWFFPEAPIALEQNGFMAGRAWWPLDLARMAELQSRGQRRTLATEIPSGLLEARAALEATIAALEASHGVRRSALVLGGFSQGAMVTTEVALHADPSAPFAGLAALSGALLCEDRWAQAAQKTAPGLHALIAHGRADPRLPFEGAEALRDLLHRAGANVDWAPHHGGHELPDGVLSGLGVFARARLGAG